MILKHKCRLCKCDMYLQPWVGNTTTGEKYFIQDFCDSCVKKRNVGMGVVDVTDKVENRKKMISVLKFYQENG